MWRWGRVAGAALVALLAVGVGPAVAAGTDGAQDPSAQVLAENVMLTPQEVADLGFSADRVRVQEQGYEALNEAEHAQQQQLRDEQQAIAPNVPPGEPTEVTGAVRRSGGEVSPQVTEWPCWLNNSGYYRVTDSDGKSRCWASGGSVTWNSASIWERVRDLRPGDYEGRILWDNDGASVLYWSVWRGPSSTTYSFDSQYDPRMWGLQLK